VTAVTALWVPAIRGSLLSTKPGDVTSLRFSFAFSGDFERYRDVTPTEKNIMNGCAELPSTVSGRPTRGQHHITLPAPIEIFPSLARQRSCEIEGTHEGRTEKQRRPLTERRILRSPMGWFFGQLGAIRRPSRRSTSNRVFGSWEDHTRNLDTETCFGYLRGPLGIQTPPYQICPLRQ
jgi:hypothetical protein